MKSAIVCAVVLLASTMLSAQSNPVPLVNNPLVPTTALPGGASFTLTVNGTGFVSGSTVDWNGTPLATTFISGSQLMATVPAANIATAGTGSVTVVSPPPGGGMSNVAWFAVRKPFPAVSFGEVQLSIGSGSSVPIAADFNGDGKLDIALDDGSTAVLLGNGDGTFQPAVEYSPQGYLLSGDFNGDGVLDIAIFNGDVSVLLGNGDGTFQAHKDSPAGLSGMGFVAGDFNGDGKLDLAVTNSFSGVGQVGIMLGNGDGTFQLPVLYSVGSSVEFVATGDFNGDGKLDLAVTGFTQTSTFVAILLGNGDGSFQNAVDYSTSSLPEAVMTADFNGDGKLDLAVKTVVNGLEGNVLLLLGNGDGSFQNPTNQPSTTDTFMAMADLNGDGNLDVVVPTFEKTQVFLGIGDGHLGASGFFPSAPEIPAGPTIGDFNGDGLVDIVVAGFRGISNVSFLPQITSVLSETLTYFGSVKLGKSKTRQVTLMNYGDKVLSIDLIGVQGDDASVFSETNTCGSGLQPGASCKIAITFTPQRPRQYTMARVAIRDSATRLSQKIMLEGMGLK